MSKIMAVLVAAIMVVAMTVPAWAEKITIRQNNTNGKAGAETYDIYKIFDATKKSDDIGDTTESAPNAVNADKYTAVEEVDTDEKFTTAQANGQLYKKDGADYIEVDARDDSITTYYYLSAQKGISYTILENSPWFAVLWDQDNNSATSTQNWVTLEKTTAVKDVSGAPVAVWNVIWDEDYSQPQARAFAKWLLAKKPNNASIATGQASTGTTGEGDYKLEFNVEPGYYLVTSTLGTELVLATSDITINTKNSYPGTDKAVAAENYSIGDTVTYTVTVDLPKTVDYTKPVIVHDTMDACLGVPALGTVYQGPAETFDSDKAAFNGVTLVISDNFTSYYNGENGKPSAHESTHATADGKKLFDFYINISSLAPTSGNEPVDKKIVITYTAELLSTNALTNAGTPIENNITNTEFVEYSKYKTTPESDEFQTFDFKLEKKFEGESSGDWTATFNLFKANYVVDANGTYYKLKSGGYTTTAPITTGEPEQQTGDLYDSPTTKYKLDATGSAIAFNEVTQYSKYRKADSDDTNTKVDISSKIGTVATVEGLAEGVYCLREKGTANGYNLLTSDIFVEIDGSGVASVKNPTELFSSENDKVTIVNKTSAVLPSTGGMGTTVLYIVGGMLVILAGAYLFFSRKRTA